MLGRGAAAKRADIPRTAEWSLVELAKNRVPKTLPEGKKRCGKEEEPAQSEALCGNPHRRANKPRSDAVIVCHAGPVICFKL